MRRCLLAAVAAVVMLSSGLLIAQEARKIRGTLPANYGKLSLNDRQKQEIYRIQASYDQKIENLQQQLDKLRQERKTAIDKVLTPAQKARLREIATEKLPGDEAKKPEK